MYPRPTRPPRPPHPPRPPRPPRPPHPSRPHIHPIRSHPRVRRIHRVHHVRPYPQPTGHELRVMQVWVESTGLTQKSEAPLMECGRRSDGLEGWRRKAACGRARARARCRMRWCCTTAPARMTHLNTGGSAHFATSMREPKDAGRARGTSSTKPPPVMCAMALTSPARAAGSTVRAQSAVYAAVGVSNARLRVVWGSHGQGAA